jgi:hypothetical protein
MPSSRRLRWACRVVPTPPFALFAYLSNCLFGIAEQGNLESQLTFQIALLAKGQQGNWKGKPEANRQIGGSADYPNCLFAEGEQGNWIGKQESQLTIPNWKGKRKAQAGLACPAAEGSVGHVRACTTRPSVASRNPIQNQSWV